MKDEYFPILTALQSAQDRLNEDAAPVARELVRKALEDLEGVTERNFDNLPDFLSAALRYLPREMHGQRQARDAWFLPWDDPRSRLLGMQEQVSGDRLTITLTALKDAPEEWWPFVKTYFNTPSARHMLACMLTEDSLADVPSSFTYP